MEINRTPIDLKKKRRKRETNYDKRRDLNCLVLPYWIVTEWKNDRYSIVDASAPRDLYFVTIFHLFIRVTGENLSYGPVSHLMAGIFVVVISSLANT